MTVSSPASDMTECFDNSAYFRVQILLRKLSNGAFRFVVLNTFLITRAKRDQLWVSCDKIGGYKEREALIILSRELNKPTSTAPYHTSRSHAASYIAMEAVRKAASEAVDTIRNSPLFRRKFGNRSTEQESPETPRPLHPESDRTPFVQGVYFQVHKACSLYHTITIVYWRVWYQQAWLLLFNLQVYLQVTGHAWLPTCINTNFQILTCNYRCGCFVIGTFQFCWTYPYPLHLYIGHTPYICI